MQESVFPWFQPIVDVGKMCVSGHEALGRRLNAAGQVESLGPLFVRNEHPDLLLKLDRSIRRQAFQRFAQQGQPGFLTLNISPGWMQSLDPDSVVPTIEMAQEFGVDLKKVVVEFVESAGENRSMQRLLERYRAEGMKVAIDDFGAGHSHIDRLLALEPDVIKLDMGLFKRAVKGGLSSDVVQSIAELAQRSSSHLLCEGVETEDEFRYALDCGARFIQGYFFWPPQADFVTSSAPKERLQSLLPRYRQEKIHGIYRLRQYLATHEQYFTKLVLAIVTTGLDVNRLGAPPSGFLRAYICRQDGEQLSPNYEYDVSTGWYTDDRNIGINWGGRPYFYEVLAANDVRRFSREYHDYGSGMLCRTLGTELGSGLLLFIDISQLEKGSAV